MAYNGAINIVGNVQQQLAFTANTEAKSGADIPPGVYDVSADQDCYIALEDNGAAAVTSSTGYPLFGGNVVSVTVPFGVRMKVISAAAGTLRYIKTG